MKITVLLEYVNKHSKGGNGTYTIFCDFARTDDAIQLYNLKNATPYNSKMELPTGLHIIGLNGEAISKMRFFEDWYYEIDVADGERVTLKSGNTTFDSYEIDFTGASLDVIMASFTRKQYEDVEPDLEKAESSMTEEELTSYFDKIAELCEGEKEFVRVKNIGQGNWNEYHVGSNNIPLVYDLGTWMNASNTAARSLVLKHLPQYKSSSIKPIVIISHWDLDHYRCLLQMTPTEIKYFEAFIVVKTLPTATACKAYYLIKQATWVKVLSIPTCGKSTSKMPIMNNPIQHPKVSIYPCIGSNRNSRGLIAVIKNETTAVLLSGDCLWSQLNHILREETNSPKKIACHLVVPHHGGCGDELYSGFVIPSSWTYGKVAISVGKGNLYNHPRRSVTGYLKVLFNTKTIDRTDILNKDIDLIM